MSSRDVVAELADRLTVTTTVDPPRLRQGKVTAVEGATVTVTIGGGAVQVSGVHRLASYTSPTVGDSIWMLQTTYDLLVLGKLA